MSELCEHETFKDICGTCYRDAQITRLTADNEKLAEALETAGRLFAAARDALAEVNAENEKLRAALERIADTDPDEGTQWFHEVATAALSGDKHE
jgi:hypothetical protein